MKEVAPGTIVYHVSFGGLLAQAKLLRYVDHEFYCMCDIEEDGHTRQVNYDDWSLTPIAAWETWLREVRTNRSRCEERLLGVAQDLGRWDDELQLAVRAMAKHIHR